MTQTLGCGMPAALPSGLPWNGSVVPFMQGAL